MLADLYLRFIDIWCDLHICLNDFWDYELWPIVNSNQQQRKGWPGIFEVNSSSRFFKSINLAALPKSVREYLQPEEASNCQKLSEDKSTCGRLLWPSLQGLCDPNWTEVALGTKALSIKKMPGSIKSFIATKFVKNYRRFYPGGTGNPDSKSDNRSQASNT